jgi:hypothetical protein
VVPDKVEKGESPIKVGLLFNFRGSLQKRGSFFIISLRMEDAGSADFS